MRNLKADYGKAAVIVPAIQVAAHKLALLAELPIRAFISKTIKRATALANR